VLKANNAKKEMAVKHICLLTVLRVFFVVIKFSSHSGNFVFAYVKTKHFEKLIKITL